jgi:poly-gamma-glutamate synthesis protein (capsule biosynthesis protein)
MKIAMKKSKRFKKALIISVILLIVAGLSVGAYWYFNHPQTDKKAADNSANQSLTQPNPQPEKPTDTVLHLSAMGDMLAHDTIIANAKTDDSYDFAKFFKNIKPSYEKSDIIFCNQEGLVSGEKYGISGYPSFNAPTEFASDLDLVGCNLINLANNHMGDKGTAAISDTIDVWSALKPLGLSGANKNEADQNKVSYATVKGVKISFVAFADFNNVNSTPAYSVNIYHNQTLMAKLVKEAKKNADIVIVSMHWGTEDSNTVNADQKTQVNLLSSLGVDIIIGTGPHVLQKAEVVKRSDGGRMVVWYSLGNMLSSQLNINQLIGGIAGMDITKNATTNKISISNLTFVPTYMHYEWTASQAANGDLLSRKNAMIYLLDEATSPLSRSLFNTTVATQKQYVVDTIGAEVTVK